MIIEYPPSVLSPFSYFLLILSEVVSSVERDSIWGVLGVWSLSDRKVLSWKGPRGHFTTLSSSVRP